MTSLILSTIFIIAYNQNSMSQIAARLCIFFYCLSPATGLAAGNVPRPQPRPSLTPAKSSTRFLLPNTGTSMVLQKEITALLQEYNAIHPNSQVQLIRRGDPFSSLRDLIAMYLAGDVPEIAVIECGETPAAEATGLLKPFPRLPRHSMPAAWSAFPHSQPQMALPFERTLPVLVADQEVLFRLKLEANRLPKTWNEFTAVAQKLSSLLKNENQERPAAEQYALALPLQGTRGLWLFEALAGKPLWKREPGGLKSERKLSEPISVLQRLLDTPGLARPEESWERAVQAFLDRKAPLLVTALDALPQITSQATFRWIAAPMPRISERDSPQWATLQGGTNLVITRNSPEVKSFLEFFYSPGVAARWIAAGGYFPLNNSQKGIVLKNSTLPHYASIISALQPDAHRTSDVEVVRARSAWIQGLQLLFGDASKRLSSEDVFIQLDRLLGTQ